MKADYTEGFMSRRDRILWVLAVCFTLVNLFGAIFAAAHRELGHTAIHELLTFLGAYFIWRLTPRDVARS